MGHRASSVTTSDGLIWATEGRVCAPAGRRYAPLVVNQTTARSMPSQQAQKRGQMIPYDKDTLWDQSTFAAAVLVWPILPSGSCKERTSGAPFRATSDGAYWLNWPRPARARIDWPTEAPLDVDDTRQVHPAHRTKLNQSIQTNTATINVNWSQSLFRKICTLSRLYMLPFIQLVEDPKAVSSQYDSIMRCVGVADTLVLGPFNLALRTAKCFGNAFALFFIDQCAA